LVVACLVLSAALLLAFPGFAWFGYCRSGAAGLLAAVVAGAVCWFGALAALVVVGLMRGGPQVLHGVLLSMFFRMGLPLVAGITLSQAGGPLAEAGVFGMIVVYYLIGLFVETLLSVRLVGSSTGGIAKAS
jgi:hypothetical protein